MACREASASPRPTPRRRTLLQPVAADRLPKECSSGECVLRTRPRRLARPLSQAAMRRRPNRKLVSPRSQGHSGRAVPRPGLPRTRCRSPTRFSRLSRPQAGSASVPASSSTAAEVIRRLLGSAAVTLMAAAMMTSSFGALHASILATARVPYAMARDRLFFQGMARLSGTHVPVRSLIVLAIWASVLALSGSYDVLTDYAIFALTMFQAGILSQYLDITYGKPVRPRSRRLLLHSPTQSLMSKPLSRPGYPWTNLRLISRFSSMPTITSLKKSQNFGQPGACGPGSCETDLARRKPLVVNCASIPRPLVPPLQPNNRKIMSPG